MVNWLFHRETQRNQKKGTQTGRAPGIYVYIFFTNSFLCIYSWGESSPFESTMKLGVLFPSIVMVIRLCEQRIFSSFAAMHATCILGI